MKTYPIYKPRSGRKAGEAGIKNKSAQADTDTFLFSLLTFIWKIRLSILEKREERRDKREKRKEKSTKRKPALSADFLFGRGDGT